MNEAIEADLKAGKYTLSKAAKAELGNFQKTATTVIDNAVQPVLDFATKGTTAAAKNAATAPTNQKNQTSKKWQSDRQIQAATVKIYCKIRRIL